ncbi:MAG: succinyl-diaminopimelate desuccinylase [Propionibacteriales bacterium]|nr:succinyl-diaminopimelate desuccinylase [Propionibacteriales bacterium]
MSLDLRGDVIDLLTAIVDIESVSGNETPLADQVEQALRSYDHLEVIRLGNSVVARTDNGRPSRVVIAGHLDTVPLADNLPSRLQTVDVDGQPTEVMWGRGTCDMKGGVAVQLVCAAELTAPSRDVTWIFYDNEEVAEHLNGLKHVADVRPDLLAGEFAVLCEPSNAGVEGGCQGTMAVEVTTYGTASHSARAWKGHNAIHDAADVLARLAAHTPQQIEVDGLTYREGLNAVGITGGIAGNVIPDRCTIKINYRFAPDKDREVATAYVAEVLGDHEFAVIDFAAGARPGLDRLAAKEFLAAVGGEPQPKFGWTDVSRFSAMGVPAVNFGPGDPNLAHTDNEHTPVDDVRRCRDALLRWLS